jgi:uncharacterized protein (DUF885 family)
MSFNRRRLLLAAAATGLAAAARKPAGHGAHAAAPADAGLNRYFDQVCNAFLKASPETATGLGLDTGARAALKSQLSDASMAHIQADRALCREGLAKLATFRDTELSPAARLNKAVVGYAFELGREAAPFDHGENTMNSAMSEAASPYVVSQQSGAYSAIPEFLDSQHKVANAADAEAYLARVHAMARNLRDETARVKADAAAGFAPPDFILANTIGQQQGLMAAPAAQARLVTALARKAHEAKLAGD